MHGNGQTSCVQLKQYLCFLSLKHYQKAMICSIEILHSFSERAAFSVYSCQSGLLNISLQLSLHHWCLCAFCSSVQAELCLCCSRKPTGLFKDQKCGVSSWETQLTGWQQILSQDCCALILVQELVGRPEQSYAFLSASHRLFKFTLHNQRSMWATKSPIPAALLKTETAVNGWVLNHHAFCVIIWLLLGNLNRLSYLC